jgi:L-asparaginase
VVNQKIVVLATGGTLAGVASSPLDNLGYTAAQLGIEDLLAGVPALQGLPLVTEQVAQVDSKDMGFALWQLLAARCAYWLAHTDVQGIVVTHGTDTLEETAYFLQSVLAPAKPVVLTCAMRPATALGADGPQNLLDAVAVVRHPGACGVVAVCAGVVHGAREVQKMQTYRLDAFDSGDAGPLAWVEEGALRLMRNWPLPQALSAQAAIENIASQVLFQAVQQASQWPRVQIVFNHVGADASMVQALLAHGVDGIVVAATGNGTVSTGLQNALLQAQEAGVRVLRATRCAHGRVLPTANDVLPHSQGLSPVKARVALLLQLLAAPQS